MQRDRKLLAAKASVLLAAIPVLLWAYEYGPDVGYCGVPRENGTCTATGCHVGTTNNPANKGSVTISFPDGKTYLPGVKQHLLVTISDPATTQRAWGFQLTARVASNTATQAGAFASTDQFTLVMCGDVNANPFTEIQKNPGGSQTCPASNPLTYIEHSLAGYTNSLMKTGSFTYQFDWTPPAANVGAITMYIAANAANGDLSVNGDHIYSTTYTLTPCAGGAKPVVGGVGGAAGGQPGVVAGALVSIYGTGLAPASGGWDNAIIGTSLPAQLNCTSVTIGGQPAYISYTSANQINVQAPDVGAGSASVQVNNSGATSDAFSTAAQDAAPAFFLWAGKYAVATRTDYTYIGPASLFPGLTTPVKPGDVVILWGSGFGPTSPAVPAGNTVPADRTYSTASPVSVTVGNQSAQVYGAALASGFAGLYQVAIQVPPSTPDGDIAVTASINGALSPAGVFITVQH